MSVDTVVIHGVLPALDQDFEVATDEDGNQYVENFDEVEKRDVVRRMERAEVEAIGWEDEIITPEDSMWRDDFENLEVGEQLVL